MASSRNDWFLNAWMQTLRIRQVDLITSTGWGKSKVSDLTTGKVKYTRDILNEIARSLNLQPYELLLHPDDAMALRRMRDSAVAIAADKRSSFAAEPHQEDNRNEAA